MGKEKSKSFEITYGKNKCSFSIDKILLLEYEEKENGESKTVIRLLEERYLVFESNKDDTGTLEIYNKLKELMK